MKNLKLFSLVMILFLISSCSITKKVEKSITGKWEIMQIKTETGDKTTESYNKIFKELLKGSYIEFNSDKSYKLILLGKKTKETWTISEDGSKILSSESDKYFEIVNKTEERMVLKSIDGTSKIIIELKRS